MATDIIGKVKKQTKKPWIIDQVIVTFVKLREAKTIGDQIEVDVSDRFGRTRALYNKVKSVKKPHLHVNQADTNPAKNTKNHNTERKGRKTLFEAMTSAERREHACVVLVQ